MAADGAVQWSLHTTRDRGSRLPSGRPPPRRAAGRLASPSPSDSRAGADVQEETVATTQVRADAQHFDATYRNLSTAELYEHATRNGEGLISAHGSLVVRTGKHTGRSPQDKFVVREPSSRGKVWWGKVNQP